MAATIYELVCRKGHPSIMTFEEVVEAFGYDIACDVELGAHPPLLDSPKCPECQSTDQTHREASA